LSPSSFIIKPFRTTMKKCVICNIELEENEEICSTCLEFITWKYGSNAQDEIERFRQSEQDLEEWRSQKDKKEVEE